MIAVRGRGSVRDATRATSNGSWPSNTLPTSPIGAADRHDPSGREFFDRAGRANHRRHAQLASDNGGVASASAVTGDDSSSAFHCGFPIGTGRLGDQHFARLEDSEVVRIRDDADFAPGDLLADRTAGGKHPASALE
jgi:hypothetical protein